ncbi:LAMI_0C10264g1_1 [Lachancea mirantina]|uniref:Ribonuclease T2-like n=1 Tax=Lachancea mirantina TaxID=1230905 RepID=A0A1G4J5Q7_9SACH|nr:LAMI_0C10264g1_1 [Lachancea mirantina]
MHLPWEILTSSGYSALFRLQDSTQNDNSYSPTCPADMPLTCSNHTAIEDTCCFEHPGGILLQTQFWDYVPPRGGQYPQWNDDLEKHLGPNESFTNHGLWPDNCDATYEQFCDRSSMIDDVHNLLNSEDFNSGSLQVSGKDLLRKMEKYWKSNTGDDEALWIHEFNKHGTCIKTIKPKCYERWNDKPTKSDVSYSKRGVYDYFRIAMSLFEKKDTFQALKDYGIEPSVDRTYSRDEISKALSEFHGKHVLFKCDRNRALNEVWYYNLLRGSLLGEEFEAIDAVRAFSNCPETGVHFYPKGFNPHKGAPPDKDKNSIIGTVHIGGRPGFIIRNGRWMTVGTPATFRLIPAPFGNYYLRSRSGFCGPEEQSGKLVCNKGASTAPQFEYDAKKGVLGYSGQSDWHASEMPHGRQQTLVYLGKSSSPADIDLKLKFVPKHR